MLAIAGGWEGLSPRTVEGLDRLLAKFTSEELDERGRMVSSMVKKYKLEQVANKNQDDMRKPGSRKPSF